MKIANPLARFRRKKKGVHALVAPEKGFLSAEERKALGQAKPKAKAKGRKKR